MAVGSPAMFFGPLVLIRETELENLAESQNTSQLEVGSGTPLGITIPEPGIFDLDPVKRGGWLGDGSKTYPMGELFDWQSRTMRVVDYAKKMHEVLSKEMFRDPNEDGKNGPLDQYIEPRPTAAGQRQEKDNLSISADWEHLSLPLLKPGQRTSPFRFHPPPFPAHKYTPSALPSPPPKPLYQPANLRRYVPTESIILPLVPPMPTSPPISPDTVVANPSFDLKVSPIEYDSFVPTNRTVPFDLIFSILVPPASLSTFTYRLAKLTVRLTLGSLDDAGLPSSDDDQSFRPLVVRKPRNSEPPAPTMLSNPLTWEHGREALLKREVKAVP
ncbi:hypothetical protein V8C34DRAFT_305371 [Trichoderma compactum]